MIEYKITAYRKDSNEFEARSTRGDLFLVDPYVSCAYEGEPEDLIGKSFITEDESWYADRIFGCLLPREDDFTETITK